MLPFLLTAQRGGWGVSRRILCAHGSYFPSPSPSPCPGSPWPWLAAGDSVVRTTGATPTPMELRDRD